MYRSFAVATFAMIMTSTVVQAHDWILTGVKFGDGATAAGHLDYNRYTGTVSNWSITTRSGGAFSPFADFTYTPANSTATSGISGVAFDFKATDPKGHWLMLRTIYSLPACGNAIVPLFLEDASSGECVDPCDFAGTIRVVTTGALDHFEIPDDCFRVPTSSAPALAMIAAALILIALIRLRS